MQHIKCQYHPPLHHTLNCLGNPQEDFEGQEEVATVSLPAKLSSLLALNRDTDKKRVAVRKILFHHNYLDMEPLLEWELKVLPIAVNWFHKAREYVGSNEGENVDARKLSAIYQFVRALPLMFLPPTKRASGKRKISEAN